MILGGDIKSKGIFPFARRTLFWLNKQISFSDSSFTFMFCVPFLAGEEDPQNYKNDSTLISSDLSRAERYEKKRASVC
jgi:hypothetical protein